MNLKETNYKNLMKVYNNKQAKAHREMLQRKEEVYRKIPEIETIDKQLQNCGIALVKHVMTDPSLLERYHKRVDTLQHEKNELLTQYGYSQDYLEEKFDCPNCHDTGYLEDGTQCNCFKQGLIEIAYEQSNIKAILKRENFDAFSFDYYASTTKEGKSPHIRMKENCHMVANLLATFETKKQNLLLTGKTGLGKTFMCNCIAKDILDRGFTVLYFTSPQLFQQCDDVRFLNEKNNPLKEELLTNLYEVDLLIIDDLGSELMSEPRQSDLFNIINTRYLNQKSTIISTNLTLDQLTDVYSDRVVSRIIGQYTRLHFVGEDIRKQKKYCHA